VGVITYRELGLHGRSGNALFELASTIGIAFHEGKDPLFPANWMHRPYFSVPDEMFADVVPIDATPATDYATHLDPRARPYLQDLSLFWPYIDTIREFLLPSPLALQTLEPIIIKHLPGRPRLAIHVRRGDNVLDPGVSNKGDYHLCPDVDYYNRGRAVLQGAGGSLCMFSDDIIWCVEHFPMAEFYGDGHPYWKEHEPQFGKEKPRDWIDLFLMSCCDRFVISGSTFGIWGALLADTNEVVRPDQVYGPIVAAYANAELLFPPEWRTISVT
jgi:hypothetical protein